jgi:hypothetical protein
MAEQTFGIIAITIVNLIRLCTCRIRQHA